MPKKEGKNDQFGRLLCEALAPHLDQDFQPTGAPYHGFRRKTSLGHESVMVELSGANAPERILQFSLGVWCDQYEATRLELGLEPTIPGADHFANDTGNLQGMFPKLRNLDGEWLANLNDGPADSIAEVKPFLTRAIPLFFGGCKTLRGIRKLLLKGYEGPILSLDPWRDIVLIDATLADWKHLREFLQKDDLSFLARPDKKLLKRIRDVFGFQDSEP